jgi:hypothetical protein
MSRVTKLLETAENQVMSDTLHSHFECVSTTPVGLDDPHDTYNRSKEGATKYMYGTQKQKMAIVVLQAVWPATFGSSPL